MSSEDKLAVLQTVVKIEVHYLGLPYDELPLSAKTFPTSDTFTIAQYAHNDKTIRLNIKSLDLLDPYDLVGSVCHECWHAHQRAQIEAYNSMDERFKDLYAFDHIQTMIEEFANYDDGKTDFAAYAEQYVEATARAYGDMSKEEYRETIEEYISNGLRFDEH